MNSQNLWAHIRNSCYPAIVSVRRSKCGEFYRKMKIQF